MLGNSYGFSQHEQCVQDVRNENNRFGRSNNGAYDPESVCNGTNSRNTVTRDSTGTYHVISKTAHNQQQIGGLLAAGTYYQLDKYSTDQIITQLGVNYQIGYTTFNDTVSPEMVKAGMAIGLGLLLHRLPSGEVALNKSAVTNSAARNPANSVKLNKQLASQQQLGETGVSIAGAGAKSPIKDIKRLVNEYGGNVSDWSKRSSSQHITPDDLKFETHWYERSDTGQRVEQKTDVEEYLKGPK
jgi:hypothetical protein